MYSQQKEMRQNLQRQRVIVNTSEADRVVIGRGAATHDRQLIIVSMRQFDKYA